MKKGMKKYFDATFDYLKSDSDFIEVFAKYNGYPSIEWVRQNAMGEYLSELKFCLEYCFGDDYFNPFLDRKYLDYSWFVVGKKIINIDDIYEDFKNGLQEDYDSLMAWIEEA